MRRFALASVVSLLLASCYTNVFGDEFESCDVLDAEITKELASIQSCSGAADCGTVLEGSSCGCTNDLVARNDADPSRFTALRERRAELECRTAETTCDCPSANGFACTNGVCGWNFTP
jgi:hypothetical protein